MFQTTSKVSKLKGCLLRWMWHGTAALALGAGTAGERLWYWSHRWRRRNVYTYPQIDGYCDPSTVYNLANCLQPKFREVPGE